MSTAAVLYFIEKIKGNMEDNRDTGDVILDHARLLNSIPDVIFNSRFSKCQSLSSTVYFLEASVINQLLCVKTGIELLEKKLLTMVFHKKLS